MTDSVSQSQPVLPGCYEIRIREPIDDKWLPWFDEFAITRTEGGETLLTGSVPDQSALYGLLAKIRDLNLTLISVNQIEPKKDNPKERSKGK